MIVVLFFVVGLLLGSFITVVVARYDSEESILWGRSRCPQCHAMIRWYDNIPVISFLILRGRCRHCHNRIGWWYPITELSVAIVSAFTVMVLSAHDVPGSSIVLYWIVFILLMIVLVYDWHTMQIPMVIVWITVIIISISIFLQRYTLHILSDGDVRDILIGGIVGFGFLFFLSAISRERWMGAGDAYIGLIGGLIVGWPEVIFFLTVAFGIGACVGVVLLIQGKKQMNSALPFAPFLVVAIFITVFLPLLIPSIAEVLPYFS